jgi:uncharacterized membrane protein YbhN (UPF0104 family)
MPTDVSSSSEPPLAVRADLSAPPRRPARRRTLLGTSLLVLLGALLLAWVLSGFAWQQVLERLRSARLAWLAPLFVVVHAYLLVRSWRWHRLLAVHWERLPFWPLHAANAIGMVVGNFSPAQSGELLKVELVARATGRPRLELASTHLVERILDVLALGALFLIGSASSLRRVLDVNMVEATLLLVGPACVLAWILVLLFRSHARRVWRVLRSHWRRPGSLVVAAAASVVAWGLVVLQWLCVGWMLGIDLAWLDGVTLVSGVTALRILAVVPGGIGVDEFSATRIMGLLGKTAADAQAYAILLRVLDLMLIAAALMFLPFAPRLRQARTA